MPLLKLIVSKPVSEKEREELVKALSEITAGAIGKPESYMMVTLSEGTASMAGQIDPAAFADVRSIGGLDRSVNERISKEVCALLEDRLGIPGNRVYLNFTNVQASSWGWNGGTFG